MSLKFIHTADWHLGRVYRRLGARAMESVGWRTEAIRRVFELATSERAEFILVAGDVFDSDTPSAHTMRDAASLLREAPVPVYLISGNHDPCAEGSVWHHREFRDALQGVRHVRLATEATHLHLDQWDVDLFPCPVVRKHNRDDLTMWIPPAPRGSRARIGLAHGGWKGYYGSADSSVSFNEIDSGCAERCGLDYLALGDYHSYTPAGHPAAKARTYYSGTTECGASDDARPGHALVVSLDAPGAEPVVEPRPVGRVVPHDWGVVTLSAGDGVDPLETRLAAIEDREHALVRATICGCVADGERADLQQWVNELCDRVLGADIDLMSVYSEPTVDDFEALHLEPAEKRILEMLQAPLEAADMVGVRDGEYVRRWSDDEEARREARNLYYQLLRDDG